METNCNLLESTKANFLIYMTLLQSWAWHVYILPMLEFVNALMKFAQVIDNFVCDYIVIVKICTKCVEIQLPPSRLQTF